jgi:hypothetical protein
MTVPCLTGRATHGEKRLGAYMCLAGISRLATSFEGTPIEPVEMDQLAAWVTSMTMAADPTVNRLLTTSGDTRQLLEVRLMARHAGTTFAGWP